MNIIITGASSGIGQTIANHLIKLGHHVIGTSRYQEGRFNNIELLKLDVTEDDSVEKFVQQIFERYTQIDVLINNAGYVLSGPIENTSIVEAKKQIDTNYFGAVRLTQKLLPHFRANNSGKIINICSMAGQIGMPFQAHYSASKYALEGFTEALRLELSPFNIQVCNINPGDFRTNITSNRISTQQIDSAYHKQYENLINIYATEERNGADPLLIAKLIASLLPKKKLKVRYNVGKLSETSAVLFKRVFSAQIFERVIKMMWKI